MPQTIPFGKGYHCHLSAIRRGGKTDCINVFFIWFLFLFFDCLTMEGYLSTLFLLVQLYVEIY